jgi:hypothetical protein
MKYKSFIPDGVLHRERNKIPNVFNLGKKGIPVITIENNKAERQAEIEKEELILNYESSKYVELLVKLLEKAQSPVEKDSIYLKLGKYLTIELQENTEDFTDNLL